jgi:ISXO2-like transposase domain
VIGEEALSQGKGGSRLPLLRALRQDLPRGLSAPRLRTGPRECGRSGSGRGQLRTDRGAGPGGVIGGEGKEAEVDGGHVKPANVKAHRRDRRLARNQNGKRKVVVIVRERGGNSVPAVFNSESQAASFIRARIAKGTVVHADEAASWDNLHERFEIKRINHQEAYSLDGACAIMAEEYFSRLRRGEIGIHHHLAGAHLLRYTQEFSWREDNRRVSNGDQVNALPRLQ